MPEIFELYFDDKTEKQKDVPNMDGFKEIIERDYSIRGVVLKYPNSLIFWGDSYKYLLDEFTKNGFCGSVSVTINRLNSNGSDQSLKGIIFLSDVVWNWDNTTCEATIEDDNWSARIVNNLDLKVNVLAEKTKNGLDMVTTISQRNVDTYDPNEIALTWTYDCWGVDVISAMDQIVKFISDNVISFESDFLLNTGLLSNQGILLTTGLSLRTTNEDTILVSMGSLLMGLSKLYNLWFDLQEQTDGTYVFKLEPESFWFNTEADASFRRIKGINQRTFDSILYSSVEVGSDGRKSLGGAVVTLDYYPITTHLNEELYVFGDCNINDKLDLVNEFVYDTNAIEDVVVNGNDDWDDRLFLFEYDVVNNRASKNKFADNGSSLTPPFYYNKSMLNGNVLRRYFFQNDLVQTFGNEDQGFEATLSADSAVIITDTVVAPLIFDVEILDISGNYDTVTGRYTAAGNGTYTFEIMLPISIISKTSPDDTIAIAGLWIKRDAATTIYEQIGVTSVILDGVNATQKVQVFVYEAVLTTYLELNDTIEFQLSIQLLKAQPTNVIQAQYYANNSSFKTLAVYDGGGTFFKNDLKDYRASILDFVAGVNDSDWSDIKADKAYQFEVDRDGVTIMKAWIKKLERDFLTTEVNCELITNLDQTNKTGS